MEFTVTKTAKIEFDHIFNQTTTFNTPDANYDVINIKAFFDGTDCKQFIHELFQKIFQELPITYSITYNSNEHVLYVEDEKFFIKTYKKSIVVYKKSNRFNDDTIFKIQYAQNISTYNILSSIVSSLHTLKSSEYNDELIKQKVNSSVDFEYQFASDDYWNNKKFYVLTYKPLKINIKCIVTLDCIEFVSYLHHYGETWHDGTNELSIEEIKNEIQYYQCLLDNEPIVREKVASL